MPIDMKTISVEKLEEFTLQAFAAMGMSGEEARLCTNGLIQSELPLSAGSGPRSSKAAQLPRAHNQRMGQRRRTL